ncbi:phage shock envelope stress response protein PspM [Parafrankia discariae]|uniref:phage shock envelope stress response protein PspM n=1 Tax=Parafrankia discariae TaxID=365528 RepID=UPI0003A63B02|nr:hypothetical protein [Parafrankia discariae]
MTDSGADPTAGLADSATPTGRQVGPESSAFPGVPVTSGDSGRGARGKQAHWRPEGRSSFHFADSVDRTAFEGYRIRAAELAAAVTPALPDWIRADVERRSLERSERRFGRSVRRARRRAAISTQAWTAAAAASPAAAFIDHSWGWFVFGGAALVRAGLSYRELRAFQDTADAPALPVVPAPTAMALRRSAAARPLRRGEAGLAALVALARSVADHPPAAPVRTAVAGAVRLVDGLRVSAGQVLACEAAARAVADPARRAGILATSAQLLDGMNRAADALDGLLAAATEIVGTVAAPAAELRRLTEDVDRLRAYADGLSELMGSTGRGRPT